MSIEWAHRFAALLLSWRWDVGRVQVHCLYLVITPDDLCERTGLRISARVTECEWHLASPVSRHHPRQSVCRAFPVAHHRRRRFRHLLTLPLGAPVPLFLADTGKLADLDLTRGTLPVVAARGCVGERSASPKDRKDLAARGCVVGERSAAPKDRNNRMPCAANATRQPCAANETRQPDKKQNSTRTMQHECNSRTVGNGFAKARPPRSPSSSSPYTAASRLEQTMGSISAIGRQCKSNAQRSESKCVGNPRQGRPTREITLSNGLVKTKNVTRAMRRARYNVQPHRLASHVCARLGPVCVRVSVSG